MGTALLPFTEDPKEHRRIHQREHHPVEEFRGVPYGRRNRIRRTASAGRGPPCPQRVKKDCRLPRPERHGAFAFGELHPPRLRRALEFVRAMLGLSMSWIAVRARWHRTQWTGRIAACWHRETAKPSSGGIRHGPVRLVNGWAPTAPAL